MINWPNFSLSRRAQYWLYYVSLFGVLLVSCASHFIADIAQGQSNYAIENVGVLVIVQYTAMACFMLLAWYVSPKSTGFKAYQLMFAVAVIARLVLLDVSPYTSNDVDRYLFDGRIAYEGYDPYQLSHDNEILAGLREQWQPPAEHAAYVTLYPPVSLALFTFSSSFGVEQAQFAWQLLLLIAGVLTLWVSALVLKTAGKLHHFALVALSPLLILETGVGLHIDALSTLAVIGAIYFWQRKQNGVTGTVIGLGMTIKILPVMLLLPFFFSQQSLKDAVTLVIHCVLIVTLIYLTTVALGFYPVGSIGVFFEKWRSSSPLFSVIGEALTNGEILAVIFSLLVLGTSLVAYLSFRYRPRLQRASGIETKSMNNNKDVIYVCMQLSLALPLLVSPVVFPWYLLPLVPVLALWPNKYLIGWMLLMPLTYEVLGQFMANQLWQPAQWPINLLGIWYLAALASALWFFANRFKQSKFSSLNRHA